MSVEQANNFLSQSWQMKDVFEGMNNAHPRLVKENPEPMPSRQFEIATFQYVMAGLSWMANRSNDTYLEEIGTTSWFACQQNIIDVHPANDIQKAATERLKLKQGGSLDLDLQWPQLVTVPFEGGLIQEGSAILFLPFNTIVQARENPIRTLAKIAAVASQTSDFVNSRFKNPAEVSTRKVATYAHVLGMGTRLYPDFKLSPAEKDIISDFPEGIYSLPEHMRRHGINGNHIQNFRMN